MAVETIPVSAEPLPEKEVAVMLHDEEMFPWAFIEVKVEAPPVK